MNGEVNGVHYSKLVESIEKLIRDNNIKDAIVLLNKIFDEMESESLLTGSGVAPWYYLTLAKIYKKQKLFDDEKYTLLRYLGQIKDRGSTPIKIYTRYRELCKEDEKNIQSEIYKMYSENICKSNLNKMKVKCNECGKYSLHVDPRTSNKEGAEYLGLIYAVCPFCMSGQLVELK